MNHSETLRFMKRTLSLASRGAGTTHPNPMVGALVVSGGRIVGEGWHKKPGESHAEAMALKEAGPAARGGFCMSTWNPVTTQAARLHAPELLLMPVSVKFSLHARIRIPL